MITTRLIFVTLMAGVLIGGAVYADDLGPPLSAEQMKQEIINKKEWLVAPDGKAWGGIYNQDGSYVYGNGSTGTWRIDGNKFCNKPDGAEENCGTIHQLDAKSFQFIRADGSKGVVIKLP